LTLLYIKKQIRERLGNVIHVAAPDVELGFGFGQQIVLNLSGLYNSKLVRMRIWSMGSHCHILTRDMLHFTVP